MHDSSAKHYPTYLVLVIGMITSFFLGALLVEVPFSTGLGYFQNLQHDNLVAKQMHLFQKRTAEQMVEISDSALQRGVATCRTTFDTCAQGFTNSLMSQSITQEVWAQAQGQCARTLTTCITKAAQ
jgi:hypothetical protein